MEQPAVTWRLGTVCRRRAPATVLELGSDGDIYGVAELAAHAAVALPRPDASVLEILRDWDAWLPLLDRCAAAGADAQPLAAAGLTWLPPVLFPGKLICVGANYRDHLDEMGITANQTRPFVFLKPAMTSMVAHGGQIGAPAQVTWLDWEAELAVVMGTTLRDGRGHAVLDAVAGYTSLNDISARDWAEDLIPGLGQDWFLHKAFDHFTPIGPTITPARYLPDPQSLDINLEVNGVAKQSANTSDMIFSVVEILEHLSSITTLEPGDIVATGSPAGVGFGRHPREQLMPGDEVVVRIEGLSELRNTVGPRGERLALPRC
jgi:2-keto-4-pentenoate hydratase/2-oxohepta-3-ene-1,7-dioic acid hydratase in catechol pathway